MANVITGDAELRRKLAKLKDLKSVVPVLQAATLHVKGKIAEYPEESSANKPGGPGSHWYERGYGSKWMRKDGTVNGRQTSETLGRKWTIKNEKQGLRWLIGNNVSYGPYVQGDEQASIHASRHWKTTSQVIEEEEQYVLDKVKKEVDRILMSG